MLGNFDAQGFDGSVGGFDVDSGTRPAGGFPSGGRDPYRYARPPQKALPSAAETVIQAVAARQAEYIGLDEQQRLEELHRELALRSIEYESRYLEELNARREQLIDAEIGRRLKMLQEDENVMLLILMASV